MINTIWGTNGQHYWDHGLVISYTIGTWQLPGNMDLNPPGQHSTWELNQNLWTFCLDRQVANYICHDGFHSEQIPANHFCHYRGHRPISLHHSLAADGPGSRQLSK